MTVVNGGKVAVVKGMSGDGRVIVFWEEEAVSGVGVKVAVGGRVARGARAGERRVATGFGVQSGHGGEDGAGEGEGGGWGGLVVIVPVEFMGGSHGGKGILFWGSFEFWGVLGGVYGQKGR